MLPFSVKSLLEGETPYPPSTAQERLMRIHPIWNAYAESVNVEVYHVAVHALGCQWVLLRSV